MTAVFYLVSHIFLGNPTPKSPVFLLCGVLPWNWCSAAAIGGVGSVVGSSALIKKVYLPRELLPISIILSNMVHFLLALPVLLLMMVIFGTPFTAGILFIPPLMVIQLVFLAGVALFLPCLNVFLRDTASIMGMLISLWFFMTPVFYRVDDVANQWANLVFMVHHPFTGHGRTTWRAKSHALMGLPKMLGKRRGLQPRRSAAPSVVNAALDRAWLSPYQPSVRMRPQRTNPAAGRG